MSFDLSLGIENMFKGALDLLFSQFFKLLDVGYRGAINILETIFGTKFPEEVKSRQDFTLSVVATIILAFVAKTSYSLFVFSSGFI